MVFNGCSKGAFRRRIFILRIDENSRIFRRFSLEECNEIGSLRRFNSRKGSAEALVALHVTGTKPQNILSMPKPEESLLSLSAKARMSMPAQDFDDLVNRMGTFFSEALYNYDDRKYPLCEGTKEALGWLSRNKIKAALVSNRQVDSVKRILAAKDVCNSSNS